MRKSGYYRIFILIFLSFLCNSCIKNYYDHGIKLKEEDVAKLQVGSSKSYIVKAILSEPSIIEKADDKEYWYYVSWQKKQVAFFKPDYTKYSVLELEFKGDTLQKMKNYGLEDLQKVAFSREITPETGKKIGFWKQILKNVGRFGEEDVL